MTQDEHNRLNRAISEKRDEWEQIPLPTLIAHDYCSDWRYAGPLLEELHQHSGVMINDYVFVVGPLVDEFEGFFMDFNADLTLLEAISSSWAKWKELKWI